MRRKGVHYHQKDDGSGTFFEKIVEISDAIKDKLQLTMVVATAARTDWPWQGICYGS